jgi:hypothetical protein
MRGVNGDLAQINLFAVIFRDPFDDIGGAARG